MSCGRLSLTLQVSIGRLFRWMLVVTPQSGPPSLPAATGLAGKEVRTHLAASPPFQTAKMARIIGISRNWSSPKPRTAPSSRCILEVIDRVIEHHRYQPELAFSLFPRTSHRTSADWVWIAMVSTNSALQQPWQSHHHPRTVRVSDLTESSSPTQNFNTKTRTHLEAPWGADRPNPRALYDQTHKAQPDETLGPVILLSMGLK